MGWVTSGLWMGCDLFLHGGALQFVGVAVFKDILTPCCANVHCRPGQMKHYPPNHRLLFSVVPSLPRIEVSATSMPSMLYQVWLR
jgi:hypothetical protein